MSRREMPHLKEFFYGKIAIEGESAKEVLADLQGGWLYPEELERAHKIGKDPTVTEEHAEEVRKQLEIAASGRYNYWVKTQ